MAPWGPKSGQNKLKIAVLPRKSAQRAYFVLEEVEQGWNTKEGIQLDNVRPIFQVKMVREKNQPTGFRSGKERPYKAQI